MSQVCSYGTRNRRARKKRAKKGLSHDATDLEGQKQVHLLRDRNNWNRHTVRKRVQGIRFREAVFGTASALSKARSENWYRPHQHADRKRRGMAYAERNAHSNCFLRRPDSDS